MLANGNACADPQWLTASIDRESLVVLPSSANLDRKSPVALPSSGWHPTAAAPSPAPSGGAQCSCYLAWRLVRSSPYVVEDAQPHPRRVRLDTLLFFQPLANLHWREQARIAAGPPTKQGTPLCDGWPDADNAERKHPTMAQGCPLACLPVASEFCEACTDSADRLPFLFMAIAIALPHSARCLAQKGRGLSLLQHHLTLHDGFHESAPHGNAIERFPAWATEL